MTTPERNERAAEALAELFCLIEDGVLVRNTAGDSDRQRFIREALRLTIALKQAQAVLDAPIESEPKATP